MVSFSKGIDCFFGGSSITMLRGNLRKVNDYIVKASNFWHMNKPNPTAGKRDDLSIPDFGLHEGLFRKKDTCWHSRDLQFEKRVWGS